MKHCYFLNKYMRVCVCILFMKQVITINAMTQNLVADNYIRKQDCNIHRITVGVYH